MDASIKQILVKAIQLLKSGDRAAAVPLLAGVLKQEPRLVQAWYLLGLAVDSDQKKIRAFEQALVLDPFHEKAKAQLQALRTAQDLSPSEAEGPPLPEPGTAQDIEESGAEEQPPPEPQPLFQEGLTPEEETVEEPPEAEANHIEPLESLRADFLSGAEPSDEETSPEETPDSAAPFSAPSLPYEDQPIPSSEPAGEPAPTDGTDFDLPDWMQDSTFDPSNYQSSPAADDQIYENAPEDIPEWAQMNPWDAAPPTNQPEEADQPEPETETPAWAQKTEEPSAVVPFTDEDAEGPAWDNQPEETAEEDIPDQYDSNESDMDRVTDFLQSSDEQAEPGDEEDPPEEPDWLRDIAEKESTDKKKKSVTPSQKKRRRRIILNLVLVLLCVGAGVSGYLFREQLKPYTDKVWLPVLTQAEPVTRLLTQDAPLTYLLTPGFDATLSPTPTIPLQPTAEPTWTPENTAQPATSTPRPTLAPGETPTATPTLAPLPSGVLGQMAKIESKLMLIRGKGGPPKIEREFLSNPNLKETLGFLLVDEAVQEKIEDQEIVLQALGFINGNYNLTDAYLNTQADAIGGFYYPEINRIFIVGSISDGFGAIEEYVYAHEFTHAILDQHFDLPSLGYYPTCTIPNQECQAIKALIEGDASLSRDLYFEEFPPDVGFQDIVNFSPPNNLFPGSTPDYFSQGTVFAYEYGLAFVTYLYDNGGWPAINRAYSFPPATTEQILHPEKFLQQEGAGQLASPGYADLRSQEWELIEKDSLGEWSTFLLLAHNDYSVARRPEDEAAKAAAGWSADEYEVYYNPEQQQVFLSVYWSWDTVEDTNQFYTSLADSLSLRFGNANADSPGGGECWFYRGQKSCIQKDGTRVYWLLSEDTDLLDSVRERFKLFP